MTNSELLTTPKELLSPTEQQRKFLIQEMSYQQPCPNCGTKQNVFEATGTSVKDYTGNIIGKPATCIACKRELKHAVPLVMTGPVCWFWMLVPIKPTITQGENKSD